MAWRLRLRRSASAERRRACCTQHESNTSSGAGEDPLRYLAIGADDAYLGGLGEGGGVMARVESCLRSRRSLPPHTSRLPRCPIPCICPIRRWSGSGRLRSTGGRSGVMHRGARCPGAPGRGLCPDLAGRKALKERDTGERGQPVHQLVLESRVTGSCGGRLSLPVVPVAAAHGCGGVIADGEPCLREIADLQIAGCRWAAHLGRDPARIDGVAEYLRPDARDGERERGYLVLALVVGLCGLPR